MRFLKYLMHPFIWCWDWFDRTLCRSLPNALRHRWSGLWNRKDEFHPCYDSNPEYTHSLPPEKREKIELELIRRRRIAHERDLNTT